MHQCFLKFLVGTRLSLIWFQPEILRNIDAFQVILAFLFLFIRNLIISIKYGYFRPEDYAMLGEDPPKWVEDNTNRRLVGLGWSNPSQYPGLIEDELICAMDETDVSLKGYISLIHCADQFVFYQSRVLRRITPT